jgi:hypothetical protein
MKPSVLIFNITDKARYDSVVKAVLPLKIKIKNIAMEDYLQPIGYLAGVKEVPPVEEKYDGAELTDEMLLFSNLSDGDLNQLLLSLRKSNTRINLKAVLTPNNQHWNALQLNEELKKENEAFSKNV